MGEKFLSNWSNRVSCRALLCRMGHTSRGRAVFTHCEPPTHSQNTAFAATSNVPFSPADIVLKWTTQPVRLVLVFSSHVRVVKHRGTGIQTTEKPPNRAVWLARWHRAYAHICFVSMQTCMLDVYACIRSCLSYQKSIAHFANAQLHCVVVCVACWECVCIWNGASQYRRQNTVNAQFCWHNTIQQRVKCSIIFAGSITDQHLVILGA